MQSCEFVTMITALACAIAEDRTTEEIELLAAAFTQLGDTLITIAVQNENRKSKDRECYSYSE